MTTEHVFLVALMVEGEDRAKAEEALMGVLPDPARGPVECWWVAEDDRNDRSDNDSAVFVHPGATQVAFDLLRSANLTGDCNKPHREGGQFTGTFDPHSHEPSDYDVIRHAARGMLHGDDVLHGGRAVLERLADALGVPRDDVEALG